MSSQFVHFCLNQKGAFGSLTLRKCIANFTFFFELPLSVLAEGLIISKMECNKDDAIKCKGIAEKKLEKKDIAGANKFALKAQSLFPNLEGLSALLEVINLYVASQKKINGEVDLYGIFGLDPSVDDDTLRKKYRKMALVFHPDENKSTGAAGAFLILTEAFSVLSDKEKRSTYNLKLNLGAPNPPLPTDRNGFCNFTSSSSSQNVRNKATDAKTQHMPTQSRTSAPAARSHVGLSNAH
ncbi:unnamed protein product [Fraxinus pennsylvanica]|uniref:J domain-containing protein n=1 Tax=Fraxinus pennsylvanica TaxID=56036 RepID=A0AAD2DT54_9LAMI|nr:unnamed protein product [Fraxinus pennsylvanica]